MVTKMNYGEAKMKTTLSSAIIAWAIMLIANATTSNPSVFLVNASIPNEQHPANAMWIEPSSIELSTETYDVGHKFNLTVWVNITSVPSPTQAVTAWQFAISYNKSQLNATKCGYTEGTKSQFFKNITAVPVEPQFGSLNTTHNFVMHGETWISGPKRTIPGYGSLSWVEFKVIAKPPQNQGYASLISLITEGVRVCKILDSDLKKVSFTPFHSDYRYGPYTLEIPIKGGQNATIEGNVILTKAVVTKNALHFDASGPLGSTGWINVTFPMVNTTKIKVFINKQKLTPPPFPIITKNATHYFIYFEFTLSTHEIAIEYATTNIATTNITTSKTIVGRGYTTSINVTVENQGIYTETFNITAYANTTIISQTEVTLTSGNFTTITFTWNTTGFAKGNYTIKAYAWPVPSENATSDNTLADGWIIVTIPGDIDGSFSVDGGDLGLLGFAWYTKPGDANWNPNADIDGGGLVDGGDLGILGLYWFQTDP
jgi:hypothetical protein